MATNMIVQDEAQLMESVLLDGDLSKLNPFQRVSYYQRVCESLGLNPLTKPFDYIRLNNRLTLYAKKDAADQLRKINNVSIDDVDITETDKQYIVKVKGHDATGRADVEVGVVNKTDMSGNLANAQMKAVTKAKRRLTLSLCGLGWLDETEVQTIPDAKPVIVTDNGEIVDTTSKPVVVDPEAQYNEAKQVVIKTSKGEKFVGEMTLDELNKVVEKSIVPANVEAAKIVMAHDFQMEPETIESGVPAGQLL